MTFTEILAEAEARHLTEDETVQLLVERMVGLDEGKAREMLAIERGQLEPDTIV